jgi:hypothetical protein
VATTFPTLSKQTWPHESISGELDTFYGNPTSMASHSASPQWSADNLTTVVPLFAMTYEGKPVAAITIHKKCAASLKRILDAIWTYTGKDQAKINAAHLNEFGGSFNYRSNVNSPSRLSLHAYGAALDLAPDQNPNGKPWVDNGTMLPRWAIDAFLAEGWCWGGDFNGTKDPMHFQATFNSHADAPQDQPAGAEPTSAVITPVVQPSIAIAPLTPVDAILAELKPLRDELLSSLDAKMKTDPEWRAWRALDRAIAVVGATAVTAPAAGTEPRSPTPPSSQGPTQSVPAATMFLNITATVFGGPGDEQELDYKDVPPGWADRPGVALPARFEGSRPRVEITRPSGANGAVVCEIIDVGPWNTDDPYWTTGTRPQAETGTDRTGRKTNGAGIDLTPAAAKACGLDGKGLVNWRFVP